MVSSSHGHGLKPPGKLNTSGNFADAWKSYRQVWEDYSLISGLQSHTEEYKVAFFLPCMGMEGLKIYNGFEFENEPDSKILQNVLEKFDEYTLGQTNETYEQYVFNSRIQEEQESIDAYVTVLRNLAKSCNFCDCMRDSLIRDRIVFFKTMPPERSSCKSEALRSISVSTRVEAMKPRPLNWKLFLAQMLFTKSMKEKTRTGNPHEMEKMIRMRQETAWQISEEVPVLWRLARATAKNPNHARFTESLKCPRNPHQAKATSNFLLEWLRFRVQRIWRPRCWLHQRN